MSTDNTLVFQDDDGNESEFEIITSVEYNDNFYLVLYPMDVIDDEDEGVVILKQVQTASDTDNEYEAIEDEVELEAVFQKFMKAYNESEEEEEDSDSDD